LALMTMYGFQAVECHGNMDQTQRLEAVEKFQLGRTDFLIATDLIARGLDITNVKAVINFSFPTEPKRFLHRIGRTARAGQHGVAITLCNDEERKELKKLNRKLNQTLHTFTIQNKYVDPIFNKIKTELDVVINDVQCELEAEREQKEAMRELRRSENMIKYKKEIDNRPRKEWF
jgi:ATP-dependent RNA helicase DDX27